MDDERGRERRRAGVARAFLEQALELSELVAEALDDYEPVWPNRDPEDVALALFLHHHEREVRETLTMERFLASEGWAKMVELETLFLVVHAYERLREQARRTIE